MRLYVLRHAIAEEPRLGQPDSSRHTTERGRFKARRVLSHARHVGVHPDVVLTSPYPRASETAEIACQELRLGTAPIETRALEPYMNERELWNEARGYLAAGDVMVVGHNPQLSSLVMLLMGAAPGALWLKKSGLVALDVEGMGSRPAAMLLWLLTPGSVGK